MAEEVRGWEGPLVHATRMLDSREQSFLLKLARDTIAGALAGLDSPAADGTNGFSVESPLFEDRGVFITLTQRGNLRGCIGSIDGSEPLIHGVSRHALNAAFNDPRFPPLRPADLQSVAIEISVLTPPIPVPGIDAIDVTRHGVLLEKEGRHAVFLPQVAREQGWDRDTMLRHLCRKAGLGQNEWREGARFEVFEAQTFEERPAP